MSKVDDALKAREERKKKELEEANKKQGDKVSSALAARDKRIKSNLQSTLTDLDKRIREEAEILKGVSTPSWGSEAYKSAVESTRQSRLNVESLQREVEALRKYIGDEDTDKVLYTISEMNKAYDTYLDMAEFYSSFETEDAYNKYVERQKDYAASLEFDLEAGQAEIDTLKANRAEVDSLKAELARLAEFPDLQGQKYGNYTAPGIGGNSVIAGLREQELAKRTARVNEINARLAELGAVEDIDATISEKERYLSEARRLQEWHALGAVGDSESKYYDPEFDAYSSLGADTHYTALGEKTVHHGKGAAKASSIDKYRAAAVALYEHQGNATPEGYDKYGLIDKYRGMTDTEFSVFAYYLGKDQQDGTNLAEHYIDSIEESLNSREATSMFENMEGKWALELLFGVAAGLDQFATGVENLFSDKDYIPATSTQMASQKVREDLGKSDFKIFGNTIGQTAYDAVTTTSNMLPSILASALANGLAPGAGAVVGAGLLSASAAGNSYAEMLNLGYTKGQARDYAALVGASEGLLQYAIGGIGALGGKFTGNALTKVVSKIDNALARVAISLGGEMASEAVEEGLQTVLEEWFKSEVTGMDFDAPDIDEVLYSSLLGAISAAGFGGAKAGTNAIAKTYDNIQANKMYGEMYGAYSQDIINKALEIGGLSSELATKYQPRLDNGKNLKGSQIRRLIGANEKGIRSNDTAKIASAAEARLIELGETGDVKALASILAKQASGESISASDVESLQNSRYAQRVANELDIENIQSGEYTSDWVKDIGTERINADIYNLAAEVAGAPRTAKQALPVARNAASVTENTPAKPNVTERVFEASDTGKTIYNGEEVSIEGIADIKDGELTLRLDNGETVSAREVSFATRSEALVYEAMANMGASAETANLILANMPSEDLGAIPNYVADATLAYQYGTINYEKGLADLKLPDAQKSLLYKRGREDANTRAEQAPRPVSARKTDSAKPKKNGIFYEDENTYNEKNATDIQKASIKGIEALAKFSPTLEFHVFSSEVKDGKRIAHIDGRQVDVTFNGYFTDGYKIYIDLNAGKLGNGVMLYTMSHEIGHDIRRWNPKGFKVLGDFLIEQYGKNGVPVGELIAKQKEKIENRYKRDEKAMPSEAKLFDMAYEEMVCDAMSTMFADPKAYEKLAELKKRDANVFNKLGEAIKKVLAKLKSLLGIYKEHTPDAIEAGYVMKFAPEVYEKLQDLYLKAFVDAQANYEAAEKTLGEGGIMLDSDAESVSPMFSERTWTASDYVLHRDQMAKKISEALGVTVKKAKAYIDDINSIARIIANDRARLDYEASSFGSAFVSNVEYGGSFDYTTLCKKRRIYTGTFTEIQKRLSDVALSPDDILKIRNLLIEAGVEATCGLCYVEGSRANMGKFAKEFIRLYKRDNPSAWIPNMADVNTPDGVEQMRINHPEAYDQYVYFWNHYGKLKDSDPALFASQQKPKLYEARKEYKGEILEHFKGDSTVSKKNLNGGIRMQSFSDFEIVHLIDTMQVIMDMSTVGLAGQAYTKVPEFARAFGNTGLKINLSLIAKGVDADGKLIFDDREGMPHETAFDLRTRYSKNVGTIIVTFTDEQLLAAMADPRIDFIIPFHRSQWKKGQYGAMGLPKGTKDYTFMQNEKLIKQTYHEYQGRWVKDKASNYMPNEYWDFSKSGKENAEAYLKMCAENNKRPKFYKLLENNGDGTYSLKADGSTDGYWKLLIDFKMYDNDGVGSPQQAVTPTFNMDEARTMLDEYQGGHSQYPVASAVVDAFVEDYNSHHNTNEGAKADDTKFSDRDDTKYSYRGVNENGIEVYETSEEIKKLPIKERQTAFLDIMRNQYRGRTAKFIRNGHAYYASFDYRDINKNIYGDKLSDRKGWKAKINVGAEGEIFELVENAEYNGSRPESGKKTAAHSGVGYWDYFIKTVQIDNTVFDLVANVRKKPDGQFVYSIQLNENKKIKASPSLGSPKGVLNRMLNASDDSISQNTDSVKRKYSDRDSEYLDAVNRGDMETAQKMVDEAAKKAGYTYGGYHGTQAKPFTVFKRGIAGIYLATNRKLAEDFATGFRGEVGTVYNLVAKLQKPFVVEEHIYSTVPYYYNIPTPTAMKAAGFNQDTVSTEEIAHFAEDNGYDGVIIKGVREGADVYTDDIIVFDPNQVKSADPVTYDDNGDVIPLSKRFNAEESDIRYSDRDVVDISNEEYRKMYHHFGSTKNYEVAGYLLGNGIMLDFSGKHWGDDYSTSRQVDHRDIQEVLDDRGNNGVNAMIDMISNGNIRLMPETGGICLAVKPNATQMSVLRGYFNHFKGEVVIDIDKVGGDTIHSWEYTRGTSSSKILADIKAYFDEGVVPEKKADDETDIRQFLYSDRDNIGYHAGDLGKAEFYHQQGYSRGTGHFGTGTYFVDNEEKISGATYGKRPHHAVDFSDYKLYKVKSDKDGYELHEQLKVIDGGISQEWYDAAVRDQYRLVGMTDVYDLAEKLFPEDKYSDEAMAAAIEELAAKHGMELMSREAFSEENFIPVEDEDFMYYYLEYLKSEFNKESDRINADYGELRDAYFHLWLRFGSEETRRAMQKTILYQNELSPDGVFDYNALKEKRADSLATVFMKALGYEGIDVRGTGLDNVSYGSVIYDLKKDTVLYSDRDSDSISTRSLLANALEGAAQNDIERQKLAQYKAKIELIEAEQKKLSEIRLKIRELSFAKGPRDTEQIRKLQFEEKQTANRINTYDRQLLNLQSTTALKNVLEREKKLAYEKAKREGKEALANYREKAAATQRELLTKWQDSRKKAVEGRKQTEMRHKIRDIVKELDTLLRNPTSKKHIKEELRKGVADALLAINFDTVGAEERVAKYDALIAKAKDPDVIAELTATRDRIQLQGDNLKEKLDALRMAYERIKDSEDIELSMSYQEVIKNSIEAVSKKVGNTSIRNMTLEQLEMVYDLYSMIRKTIRDANKAFKAKKGETIMQMAEAVNDQVRTVGGQPYKRNAASAAVQRAVWTFLKPLVAFRTIGSVTLTNLYKELRNGEDTFYGDVKDAQAFIEEQYEKHGFKSWDMKETKTFTAKSGKSFDLTLEQMMSLYAYSRRDQAHDHIIKGGIVFENAVITEKNKWGVPIKYEVTTKDAFNLSEDTLAEIVDSLTAEQKAFVDAMQEYLSTTMGAKGNEVSMELLGVKLFKEKFYLPIKSSQYYLNFSTEEAGEIKLKSPAFSKETVQHANNPIVLHNFTDLWAEHVNNMSMYHSFVLALEDFTRVYNYKTRTDEKVETMSTKATIEKAYPGATKYISNFLKSLNGGVRMDTVVPVEKFTSLAKKGAVLGSASVAIQQPSAVMRAMAVINPAYFITSAPQSINLIKHKQDWAELKKYAPIAGIKEMGRFDVGMGKDTADWIKANGNVMTKIEDVLSVAPAFMDEVTWISIWNAVKRETIHNHKNLSPRSDEFLKIAGERFTEVISLTQVYDSVFSRSDLMRNKSWIAKALTAFMAEPTTTLNMLYDSWVQGKRTGSKKGFVKVTTTTTGAVVASLVLNAALKSIVMAMRDDDEDESYAEKYLEHFFGDFKDSLNPLTLIPVAKDVVSIFEGYDVERMDMTLFSDLKQAVDAFDSDNKTAYEKWSGLIGAISSFFGLPVKNVERDIRGLITTIFGDGEETTAAGLINAMAEGWKGEQKSNAQQLYEAMLNGDREQAKRIEGRFKDQDAANTALRKVIREKYEGGELSDREAKSQLAKYADMSVDEAASRVQYWAFTQDYPDYDLTEAAVAKYYSDVKPSGISIDVYYDYTKRRAKCEGTDSDGDGKTDSGSKKREVLKVINSLPISASQKDALYFAEGWAESTLNEAPWH